MKRAGAVVCGIGVFLALMFVNTRHDTRDDYRVNLSVGDEDNPGARDEMEFLILRDPAANAIPENIRSDEQKFARRLPTREQAALAKGSSAQELVWTERGPSNVGGRTRVFAADVATANTLLAGSVAGGVWKSTDDGASWRLTFSPTQIHTTTCIAQDVRPGRTNVWYVGTGEFRGSTTNNTRWGSFYRGDGIYKSTTSGDSWILLPSTSSGTPQETDAFDYVWNLATNPANMIQDEVFAATWKGIYRSTNGGGSWTLVQASDSGLVNTAGFTTDVAVTSTGVVYACVKQATVPKVFRSIDGVNWLSITPAGFPTSSGRIVIGLAPSNVNIVYFFIDSPGGFWKYTDASPSGTWENRSANLPGGLSTQTGYDQILHVKPDDPNFVLLGGTNLYRSTDAFATSATTTTIGGYPFWPQGPHHPDLQSGAFKPTNPNVYYSGNDGGVQRADDIRLPSMVWTTMNNGYNVTQFYSVAISSDSGDHAIVAGAQDNGSQATLSPGMSAWEMVSGGDGTVVEMGSVADDRFYTQSQNGPLYRINRAGNNFVSFAPSGSNNQLFVNPITLDPNDSRILYYGAGKSSSPTMASGLWRNDNAPQANSTTGWTALTATNVGTASGWVRRVSTIGISTSNKKNVVYYGTTDGIVKRVDGANTASPVVIDVTPPGLNGGTANGGFVRCVAVDPANSDKALAAFGNYNFQNLWYTTNGGASWVDVEGNLAGPTGPSVRWATIFYIGNQLHVYIGTSIGLLTTNALSGASTVWAQAAANEIGNILIAYLDYRPSDRTLAVGTHARGVFTTQLPANPTGVEENSSLPNQFVLKQNYPNPFNPTTRITFQIRQQGLASLRVIDVQGKVVGTLVNRILSRGEHTVTFDAASLPSGVYFYSLEFEGVRSVRKMVLLK